MRRRNDISLDRKFAAWLKGRDYWDTRRDYIAPRTGESDWFASGGLAPYFEQGVSGEDFQAAPYPTAGKALERLANQGRASPAEWGRVLWGRRMFGG